MSDAEEPTASVPASDSQTSHCTVVGIGASAGGISALKRFFQNMPPDSGMAFVVIVHLAENYPSNLANILRANTSMAVTEVNEALHVEPAHVYVIPPGKYLEMIDGEIRLIERAETRGVRVPIDVFLRTLAEAYGHKAIAVILSGTGSDGTLGLKRVKEAGGIAIAQEPSDAEYDSMPQSAIATGLVDLVIPAAEIPQKIIDLKQAPPTLVEIKNEEVVVPEADPLRDIVALLRIRTGHDFTGYKEATVLRRVARRMQVQGLKDTQAYGEYMRRHPEEVESLLADLLITVTDFFRDKEIFEALQKNIVPKLFEGKTGKDQMRVWVVGCATGEEAYSTAMLLREHANQLADPPEIQIFATDISEPAIAIAREGRYDDTVSADISPERVREFFVRDGKTLCVKKEIREMVLFAVHNVTRDPPFSRIDLISCRNLLIYLNRELQEQLLRVFHFALRGEGYLFLGSSESAETSATLFSAADKKNHIYRKRPGGLPHGVVPLPPLTGKWPTRFPEPPALQHTRENSAAELHYRLIELYAPPSVLVNEEGDIIHLSGNAGRYLRLSGGAPSYNLLKVIHPDLHIDCRTLLFAARQNNQPSEARNLPVTLDGESVVVNLIVRPAMDGGGESPHVYFLVIFEEQKNEAGPSMPAASPPLSGDKAMEAAVRRLEEELQRTKNRLQLTVEQYETSIEELKASNEELQAMNEEMRSTTEELETGKEELQSVNEELSTVNHELKDKVDEVSRANSDLQNLIASTDIGLIFLDAGLRIRRWTPAALRVFNIISTDAGRPLEHLTHKLQYENIAADATQVLNALTPFEREVRANDGRWFIVRIAAYRTLENKIDGVVFAFVEITERRRMEEDLREARDRFERAVDGARDVLWDWNIASGEFYVSGRIHDLLGKYDAFPEHRLTWQDWQTLIHPLDRDRVEREMKRYLEVRHGAYNNDYRLMTQNGVRWVNSRGQAVWDGSGKALRMSGSLSDITERKQMAEELIESDRRKDQFLAMLSHELRNPLAPMTGAVELLKNAGDRATELRAREIIEHQLSQMVRMVEDLLDVSRMTLGKLNLRIGLLALNSVVELALETARPLIDAAKHRLTISLPGERLYLDGDAARLAQAVGNLLSNAAKYTPAGGEIRLSVQRENDEAVIRVQDNGYGIEAADMPHIFDVFMQARQSRAQFDGGLGIGLALVKQLVELHGGTVSAASAGLGQGSEFVMRLPLAADQRGESAAADESSATPAETRRILVVDDNEHAVEILGKWLTLEGHSVTTAVSGAQAMELARKTPPEVICLDINLPDVSGYELAARLRRELPDVRIIAISGWLQEEQNEESRRTIDRYLLKPVEFKELRAAIVDRKPTGN